MFDWLFRRHPQRGGSTGGGSGDLPPEPQLTLERSTAELHMKQQACAELFGIGTSDRWEADLELGMIRFISEDKIATAPVQVIGTFNGKDNTWLWGWDHPSVPQGLDVAAGKCLSFGQTYGLENFTTRKVSCSQEDAWLFTAVALHLSEGTGAYRGPSGSTFVFMTFGTVTLTKPS